jgi:hypothetical protein
VPRKPVEVPALRTHRQVPPNQRTVLSSVDTADARIGRPLTPMSVASVNRRVHRRAYYGAAAAGAAGYGYYNYARRCAYWRGGVCARWY